LGIAPKALTLVALAALPSAPVAVGGGGAAVAVVSGLAASVGLPAVVEEVFKPAGRGGIISDDL
jgi:hypothetical protein